MRIHPYSNDLPYYLNQPFKIIIRVGVFYIRFYGEEESDYDTDSDEELSINDFRTFKLEKCVICLEKEPKVLFCNCGHICICGKCSVNKLDNCPICKKETTILRIIE